MCTVSLRMVSFPSLRPPSLFVRSQRNSNTSSVNTESDRAANDQQGSRDRVPDRKALEISLAAAQARPAPESLVHVPLTPPAAFNASFAQAQSTRLAALSRSSPLGLRSAPKTLNEGEKDRLQGLMRTESVRVREAGGANGRGNGKRESLLDRFKVWPRHDGESQKRFLRPSTALAPRRVLTSSRAGLIPLFAAIWVLLQLVVFGIGILKVCNLPPPTSLASTDTRRRAQYEFSRERSDSSSCVMSNRIAED